MKSDDLRHGQCAFQIPNTMKEKEEVDMGIMDTLCFEVARNGSSIFEGMCKAEGRHTGGSMCRSGSKWVEHVKACEEARCAFQTGGRHNMCGRGGEHRSIEWKHRAATCAKMATDVV